MSVRPTVALLGGPASGKSTYLGAVVRALESESLATLKLAGLPDDATAYERLSEPLLELTYPQRTKAGETHTLELPLRAMYRGQVEEISLSMSDYDGEAIERLFMDRTQGFSPEWRARANARGILLFVRPDAVRPLPQLEPHDALTDRERMLALKTKAEPKGRTRLRKKIGSDPEGVFDAGLKDEARKPRVATPREPVQIPTVLAIVELLQFLRHQRCLHPGERPNPGEMRLALLASAWDSVDSVWQRMGPKAFFADRAPLLEDFLWANYRSEDVFYFGISSTAGNLKDENYRNQYREDPHGFVIWSDASGRLHRTRNVALPIEWALFGDDMLADGDII
ncbi:hypothetical protein WME79_38560 [Sorangium sp. So ce726]|uniref:TRAFAC clade GTPase domain-containing protein n=1 Tax=Sorangium sp. So ce726 TaxID=3133319 RepID=UPI003F5EC3BB